MSVTGLFYKSARESMAYGSKTYSRMCTGNVRAPFFRQLYALCRGNTPFRILATPLRKRARFSFAPFPRAHAHYGSTSSQARLVKVQRSPEGLSKAQVYSHAKLITGKVQGIDLWSVKN